MPNFRIDFWVIKPDPQLEKVLLAYADPWLVLKYIKKVKKERWTQAESIIKKRPLVAYYYAKDVLKAPWKSAEKVIFSKPRSAYLYVKNVLKARNKSAEKIIIKDPQEAHLYARYVIKGRWKEFENYEITDDFRHHWIGDAYYRYAKNILKTRWPEKEEIIFGSFHNKYQYIANVIKHRMEHLEEELINNNCYDILVYWKILKDEEKIEFKNKIIAYSMNNAKLSTWIKGYGQSAMKQILAVS